MARAERVGHHDEHGGPVERVVVVAAVPHQHVAFLLRSLQDGAVVHPGVHHGAVSKVWFVLLPLLDGDVGPVQVLERLKPLDACGQQVPVRHGVADDHRGLAALAERLHHLAGGLALPGPRSHRADGNDGDVRLEHGGMGSEQAEGRPGRHRQAGLVHDVQVRDVRVGEDDFVDVELADEAGKLLLEIDGDPIRVAGTAELGWILPVLDERDLSGRERHDVGLGIVPIDDVEVVEVAPCGAHDQDTFARHRPFQCRRRGRRAE